MHDTHHTRAPGPTAAARRALLLIAAAGLVPLAAGLSGCHGERSEDPPHEFFPDMDDSPKFKPQTPTDFFQDGRAMRPPVAGTVPFGARAQATSAERESYLKLSPELYEGIDSRVEGKTPTYVKFIPAAALDAFVARRNEFGERFAGPTQAMTAMTTRGQERFNIYCSVCHGYQGEGGDPANFTGGQVGRRWNYPVPNFHDVKYTDRTQPTGSDGYLFHVIRNGIPDTDPSKPHKMPAYADKIDEIDAWAIVSYVRVLQASWGSGGASAPSATAAPAGTAAPAPAAAPAGRTAPADRKTENPK